MSVKFAFSIVVGTLAFMALYCSYTSFVSAETISHCFTIGARFMCVYVFDSVKPPIVQVANCDSNAENCEITFTREVAETPDVKDAIKDAQITKFGKELSSDSSETMTDNSPKLNTVPPSLAK